MHGQINRTMSIYFWGTKMDVELKEGATQQKLSASVASIIADAKKQVSHSLSCDCSGADRHSYHTDGSGYADIYLYADPGDTVHVQVGAASCSTTT